MESDAAPTGDPETGPGDYNRDKGLGTRQASVDGLASTIVGLACSWAPDLFYGFFYELGSLVGSFYVVVNERTKRMSLERI